MYFFIALFTIASSCSLISARTLLGYNNVAIIWKILLFLSLWGAWLAPLVIGIIRRKSLLDGIFYNWVSFVGYSLFGFVFLLFVCLFFRDILWYAIYYAGKILNYDFISPSNVVAITKANIVTVFLVFVLSFYSLYQGIKAPRISEITIKVPNIEQEISILQINDMHIERSKPVKWFEKAVEKANSQNADIVVLVGDIVDDDVDSLGKHLEVLGKLKSRYGTYFIAGNHEFYNGLSSIQIQLQNLGMKYLYGNGQEVVKGLFLAGVPDIPSLRGKEIAYKSILQNAPKDSYKILLNHNPKQAQEYINLGFDLQLSGHTHGGQIFPFHLPVKYSNNYLSGLYELDNGKLHISNGVGYWGPPMRLFAPADITLIRLIP